MVCTGDHKAQGEVYLENPIATLRETTYCTPQHTKNSRISQRMRGFVSLQLVYTLGPQDRICDSQTHRHKPPPQRTQASTNSPTRNQQASVEGPHSPNTYDESEQADREPRPLPSRGFEPPTNGLVPKRLQEAFLQLPVRRFADLAEGAVQKETIVILNPSASLRVNSAKRSEESGKWLGSGFFASEKRGSE